jgi:hypothetical protein
MQDKRQSFPLICQLKIAKKAFDAVAFLPLIIQPAPALRLDPLELDFIGV